jgi:hypothetical protein
MTQVATAIYYKLLSETYEENKPKEKIKIKLKMRL